jgi:hypothetical protein
MSPSRHLDDEQLSALLDGLAEPADVAHAESCQECAARIESWRTAVRLAATPPADPPAVIREAAIHAALSARSPAVASTREVTPIRRSWRRSVADHGRAVAGAAAALLIVAGLSTAVAVSSGGGSSKGVASIAGPTRVPATAPVGGAGTTSSGAGSAGAGAGASASAAGPPFGPILGTYTDPSALAAALRAAMNASPAPGPTKATATPPAPETPSCQSEAARVAGARNSPVVDGSLTYQGTPAVAYVFVVNGRAVAVVERIAGCATLIELTL